MSSDAYERILTALDSEDRVDQRNGRQSTARCPAHDDGQASLSIGRGDGRVLVHCHAGCNTLDVLEALRLDWSDTFDGDPPKRYTRDGLRRAGATVEPDGRIRIGTVRYLPGAPKGQRKSHADPGSKRTVYPDPGEVPGDVLWLVEGGGDLLTAATLELPAVAVPSASFKLSADEAARLAAGRSRVVVVADSDGTGRTAAARWAGALAQHCPDVRVLDLHPDRDDGADLSDWVADANGPAERAQARELLDLAADQVPRVVAEQAASTSTWRPVDTAPVLAGIRDGRIVGPVPELLRRSDGAALLYPGELHSLAAEPETGKGLLIGSEVALLVNAGRDVLYLDFEDSPANLLTRFLALGATPEALQRRLVLVRPDDPLSAGSVDALTGGRTFVLAVIDGVTEAMGLLGLEINSNDDVAVFRAQLARKLARTGAAVLEIDHVVKDRETRGRYAIGGQHKLAGVAVAFALEAVTRPSRTRAGLLKLKVLKDRHGHVRAREDASHVVALARIEPAENGARLTITLDPPDSFGEQGTFRPTTLMGRIWEHVAANPGAPTRAIREGVKGPNEAKSTALEMLLAEGFLERRQDGAAQRHYTVRDFDPDADVPTCRERAADVPRHSPGQRAAAAVPVGGRGTLDTPPAASNVPCPETVAA